LQVYRLFADILEYPAPILADRVEELLSFAVDAHGEAAQILHRFRNFVENTPPEGVEELYSGTFDLQPLCCPYIGYQIFGEEYRRGMFMAQLREHFRSCGFTTGDDLPDHLCIILRFLASREAGEVELELVTDCLVPALEKMVAGLAESTNPYRDVLQALLLLLGDYPGSNVPTAEEG
jgi:nitrate reductase delta subunit